MSVACLLLFVWGGGCYKLLLDSGSAELYMSLDKMKNRPRGGPVVRDLRSCQDGPGQGAVSRALLIRWTPHPVIVTIGDNRDFIRVLLYYYCTTITGWGVLLSY